MAGFTQLFAFCFCLMAGASFPPRPESNGDVIQETLTQLVSGPLREDDLFFLLDSKAEREWRTTSASFAQRPSASTLSSTHDGFLAGSFPRWITSGSEVTPVVVFLEDPLALLDALGAGHAWDPTRLVLVCLSAEANMTRILGHPTVQRSEFIFALQTARRHGATVFEASTSLPMNRDSRGRSLLKSPLGFWDPQVFNTRWDIFPPRFNNFGGQELALATWCDDTPYLYLQEGECTGANVEVFRMIASKLNFSFDIQMEPADQSWGTLENGTWVGMMADLERNGKHVAINYFLLNSDRARDFDFTYPYHSEGFAFLIHLPPPLPNWNRVLYPFSAGMWGAVIASTCLVATSLALLLGCVDGAPDVSSTIIKVGAGVLRQSVVVRSSPEWARVWLCCWWLAAIIISTAYTGKLIAFLTVPAYPKRPETVQELADSHIRLWICDYGNFVPGALRSSSHPALAKLAQKLDMDPLNDDDYYGSGFARLRKGTHAVLETFSYLGYLQVQSNLSAISYIMKSQIYSGHLSWFLPRHTPYTPLISNALMRLREAGIVGKLIKDHFSAIRKLQRNTEEVRGGGVLQLGQLQGAFLLWACGLGISALVFLAELLVNRSRPRSTGE